MDKKSNADIIRELVEEMPDFVSSFIYGFGEVNAHNTKIEYCRDIKRFLDFIVNCVPEYKKKKTSVKDLTLEDLSRLDVLYINNYLTDLSDNYEPATVKRRKASVSSMYSYFAKSGRIKENPMSVSKKIKLPEHDLIYLTDDEQDALLDTVENGTGLSAAQADYHDQYVQRDTAIIFLFLDTGLRVAEMMNTDMGDYSLEDGYVTATRKGGRTQKVYFSDQCAGYIKTYFDSQKAKFNLKDDQDHFPAFTALSGERLGARAVERLVKKYVAAAFPDKADKDKITPHKLRSSFAMSFYSATDHDILLLKEKLNHKSLNTTSIYARASDTSMQNTRNVLQKRRQNQDTR